jgi:hypothetical protein
LQEKPIADEMGAWRQIRDDNEQRKYTKVLAPVLFVIELCRAIKDIPK